MIEIPVYSAAFIYENKRFIEVVNPHNSNEVWRFILPSDTSSEPVAKTEKQRHEKQWVGLSDKEVWDCTTGLEDLMDCARAIEEKLREKNA